MASRNFTENLSLCAWGEYDKPKRMDFVNDNHIIDTVVGGHINNADIHMNELEKEKLNSPYTVFTYAGDGSAEKTFTLDSSYTFAIVFQKFYPMVEQDANGNSIMRFAIVGRQFGSMADIQLKTNSIVVRQDSTPTDGVLNNFNENMGQYVVLLFR